MAGKFRDGYCEILGFLERSLVPPNIDKTKTTKTITYPLHRNRINTINYASEADLNLKDTQYVKTTIANP